jgi:hypothetical protein
MPKLKQGSVLADNPDSIYRASQNIRSIALKNMDNPAEEPTLKAVKNEVDDATQSKIDKFNDLIVDINEQAEILVSITSGLAFQGNVVGAGRKMRGGKAFSKKISSHTVPTAESFKPRYGAKYSQYDYAKTGLNTNANFVGAGRRRRKMRGGADPPEPDWENMLIEEADYGVMEDVEDEEDEEDDSLAPLSELSGLTPSSGRMSSESGEATPDLEDYFAGELQGSKFEFKNYVETIAKLNANIEKARRLFNKQVKQGLSTLSRSRLIDFIGDEVAKLDEINTSMAVIETNTDRIIQKFDDFLGVYGEAGHRKELNMRNDIASKVYGTLDNFVKLKEEIENSVSLRESSGVDVRRTGAGMLDYRGDYTGVNTSEDLARIKRMNGGARGGVPILSSIASSYHRIPTKYML